MLFKRLLLISTFAFIVSCAEPQEENEVIINIHAGKMIDVMDERVLSNQIISVENERIIDISSSDSNSTYPEMINWSDCTVLPGLIDRHSHLIGTFGQMMYLHRSKQPRT